MSELHGNCRNCGRIFRVACFVLNQGGGIQSVEEQFLSAVGTADAPQLRHTARKAFRLPPLVISVPSWLLSSALSSSLSPLDSSSDSSSFWGSEEVTFAVSSCACLTFFFGLLRLQLLRGLHCDCCVFLALLGEPAQTSTQSSKGGRTWL